MLAIAMFAAGCATPMAPAPEVVTAQVPIATPVYCEVPQLTLPDLPIAALNDSSSPADCVRAYAASIAILKSAVNERQAILDGCAAPAAQPSASATTSGG